MTSRCDEAGYKEIGKPDGRRGLWMRTTDRGGLELCAGREGDDADVKLEKDAPLDAVTLRALADVIHTLGWAFEVAAENAAHAGRCGCPSLEGDQKKQVGGHHDWDCPVYLQELP